jgi:uncharacterized protein YqgC (DUF456 family)
MELVGFVGCYVRPAVPGVNSIYIAVYFFLKKYQVEKLKYVCVEELTKCDKCQYEFTVSLGKH